jgi:hypothetical protein
VTQSSTPSRAAPAKKASIWSPGVKDRTAEAIGKTQTAIGAPVKKATTVWRPPPDWRDATSEKSGKTRVIIGPLAKPHLTRQHGLRSWQTRRVGGADLVRSIAQPVRRASCHA